MRDTPNEYQIGEMVVVRVLVDKYEPELNLVTAMEELVFRGSEPKLAAGRIEDIEYSGAGSEKTPVYLKIRLDDGSLHSHQVTEDDLLDRGYGVFEPYDDEAIRLNLENSI